MADKEDENQLLFFDTFSHENTEDLNLDLVQFSKPVIISEIRVIPLGTKVTADVPGGVRLGATRPSSFKLEFFVNNLGIPNASVFEKLGVLEYKENVDIQIKTNKSDLPTDGLILKGWYATITIAVYGAPTQVSRDRASPPPPPPPQQARAKPQTIPQPVVSPHPTDYTASAVHPSVMPDRTPEWTDMAPRAHDYNPVGLDYVAVAPMPVPPPISTAHVPNMPPLPQNQLEAYPPVDHMGHPNPPPVVIEPILDNRNLIPDSSTPILRDAHEFDSPNIYEERRREKEREREREKERERERERDREHERERDRDSRDSHIRGSRERSQSSERDYRDMRGSRESSREPRDRDHWDKDRDRDRDKFRDKSRDHDRDSKDRTRPRSPVRARSRSRSRSPLMKDRRDSRDSRDSRDAKEPIRNTRDHWEGRDAHDSRDARRNSREPPEPRDVRDSRSDSREHHDPHSNWDPMDIKKETRENNGRETGARDTSEKTWEPVVRELREVRENNNREVREGNIRDVTKVRENANRDSRENTDLPLKPEPTATPMDVSEPGELAEIEKSDELFEPLTPDQPDENIERIYGGLSDGEIPEGETEVYEEISSGEDNLSDFDGNEPQAHPNMDAWEYDIEEAWDYGLSNFNPYRCELAPLGTFNDPSLTDYEVKKQQLITSRDTAVPASTVKILDMISTFKGGPHHERWVEAMESLPPLIVPGLVYIINKMDNKDVLDTLVSWTLEGLDLSKAMAQPETAYKVRHLKMGIKMTGALCSCDSFVASIMLMQDAQDKLIDLYQSQYMSSSVKLQIVRALDSSTRLRDGLDWFLGRHHLQVKTSSSGRLTPYQRMLEIMLNKQVARSMVTLSALMRKVHTYEILLKLTQTVEMITENAMMVDKELKPVIDGESPMETEAEVALDTVVEEEVELVISCLEEMTTMMLRAEPLIGQPRRTLPAKVKFSVTLKPYDPYPNLFHMFNSSKLLEVVFVLLTSPATASHCGAFMAVRELLLRLIDTQTGLLYLSAKPDLVNGITRTLIQQDFSHVEGTDDNPAQQLGLQLIYNLQAIQFIDQLREYHDKDSREKEIDDADVLVALHNLYSMSFLPVGKQAIIHVFGQADNLKVLLPFLELPDNEEEVVLMKKSTSVSYTALLLLLILRNSEKVTILEKFGKQLLAFAEQDFFPDTGTGTPAEKHAEFLDWLLPLKQINTFDYEQIPELIKLIQQYSEEFSDIPKSLITVLRILKHLCIPPELPGNEGILHPYDEETEELKYKYALVELHSAGCFDTYMTIIQKVCEHIQNPWQQGIPLSGRAGEVVTALVSPTLALVKATLSNLVMARGPKYHDLTCLGKLFQLHTIMCSVMLSGAPSPDIIAIQNDIVDSLLTFTQPALQAEESEDALSKSLWTLMMGELFKFVPTSPYTFLGGLMLISELLPLPLPIQTREELTDREITLVINQRKLWSAHLHPLTSLIQDVIKSLAGSSCQPLQQVLRRVCWQIADLAAPSALTIVRCLMDAVLESMDETLDKLKTSATPQQQSTEQNTTNTTTTTNTNTDKQDNDKEDVRSSGQTSRILNLLAFVINQPPIKAAFLHLTRQGSKIDDKYTELIPRLVYMFNLVSEKLSHVQAQESIASIVQSLCDLEVTLVPSEAAFMDQLANSLPSSEQMSIICSAVITHIGEIDHSYSSVLPALRTLTLLMDHDYGFFHIKSALSKNHKAFINLFMRINTTFSKDSSDCIATLSSAAECIQYMSTLPEPPTGEGEDVIPPTGERTQTMTVREMRTTLQWTEDPGHPLDDLEKLLQEYAKDEEALKVLHDTVSAITLMLRTEEEDEEEGVGSKVDLTEQSLPSPEPLSNQFAMRITYLISDADDDRLTTSYWLALPAGDESDQELDLVRCDIEEMSEKYCTEFDLKSEISKGDKGGESQPVKPKKKLRPGRKNHDTINTSKMRGNSNRFVAPMRGRGFGRGMMNNNRHDPFRSRPPNTSRPPSMHVDDFVKMENQHQGPNSNNQQQGGGGGRRQDKDNMMQISRGRGGFDRGGRGNFNNRGRFFSPPGNNYGNRRDMNDRGIGGGGGAGRGYNSQGANGMGGGRGRSMSRGQRGGGGGGAGPMRGMSKGSPNMKGQNPWQGRARQGFGQTGGRGFGRGGHERSVSGSDNRRNSGGDGRFGGQRGGGGGGRGRGAGRGQRDRDMDTRFMPPPLGFQGRRDRGARHQRSFTK